VGDERGREEDKKIREKKNQADGGKQGRRGDEIGKQAGVNRWRIGGRAGVVKRERQVWADEENQAGKASAETQDSGEWKAGRKTQ